MSVYRYYIPNTSPANVDLDALGLAGRLWDTSVPNTCSVQRIEANGPDGGNGALVVPHRADGRPLRVTGYEPDEFDAHKSENGDYWICWDRQEPPGPDGLSRRKLIDGYEFCGGWMAPVIRRGAFVATVPCTYSKLNGQLTRKPHKDYENIWEQSAGWFDRYFNDGISVADQFDIAVTCLAVNYRVSAEELSLLELLDEEALEHVVRSALDVPWIEEAISGADPKKKELWDQVQAVLASISPGEADSITDTDQVAETSHLCISD